MWIDCLVVGGFQNLKITGVVIMVKIAVVLLSGGLDSTTTSAFAKSLGYEVHAITVHYCQGSCNYSSLLSKIKQGSFKRSKGD